MFVFTAIDILGSEIFTALLDDKGDLFVVFFCMFLITEDCGHLVFFGHYPYALASFFFSGSIYHCLIELEGILSVF